MESIGKILVANVKEQAKVEWDFNLVPQNASFNGSAKADSGFKISKTMNQGAAWGHWGLADGEVDEAAKKLGADTDFKGILRTLSIVRWRVWFSRRAWLGLGWGRDIAIITC